MHSNYKTIFISIIFAYQIALILFAFAQGVESMRYFSLLQLPIFIVPILFIIKENNQISSPKNETININFPPHSEQIDIKSNFWDTVRNYLKLNLNFKPEIIVYTLWGLLGLNLLGIGVTNVTEFLLPNELIKSYNSLMRNAVEAQTSITTNHSKTIFEFIQITFFIALVPAICEEILFRGYLMKNIMVSNSPRFALIASALIFAFIHFNVVAFLPIFFIGLYLGALVYATKSIIPSMLLHFLNNFFVVISVNYGFTMNYYGQSMSILFGFLLFILGGLLMLFSYNRIDNICKTTFFRIS